jgi:hypothetical protein
MSDEEQAMNDNETLRFGGELATMDVEAFLNIRDWLQAAIEAKGAVVDGTGIGCGQADISFELDGYRFWVSVMPVPW